MYKLFNTEFKTKTEIKAYCKDLLETTPEGNHLYGEPLGVIIELVGHRAAGKKLIKQIKSIFIDRNHIGRSKAFFIQYLDDSINDFSYIKAIRDMSLTPDYTPDADLISNFKSAMRAEIMRQIIEYKNRQFGLNPDQVCSITGKPVSWSDVHVDHYPQAFNDILWAFCKEQRLYISEVKIIDLGQYYELGIFELKKSWQKYHKDKANLRLTTPKANTSAPKPSAQDWHSILENPDNIQKAS
jgi:hypothetical protein